VSVGAGNTDMNVDFYGGDFKIDLNEPELGWNEWTSHTRCLRWIFWWLK
jgi:hypothetical protein